MYLKKTSREKLKALSKRVYGVSSRWQSIMRKHNISLKIVYIMMKNQEKKNEEVKIN